MPTYDFIVIGSGIAGLSYTVKVAQHFADLHIPIKIALITKTIAEETNTKYAQGGIAAVWDQEDSFEKHIQDTLVAGDFLSDSAVVELVVREAPERLKELISYGTDFDRRADGSFDLIKEEDGFLTQQAAKAMTADALKQRRGQLGCIGDD